MNKIVKYLSAQFTRKINLKNKEDTVKMTNPLGTLNY